MNFIGIILVLSTLSVFGQTHVGARFASMSYATVALQDVWSAQQNQAGLCGLEKPIFSIGSAPGFLGNTIQTQALVVAVPYRSHVFGLSFQRYGITEYNEQKVGLSYARSFNTLSVALHSNYHQFYIQNYGSAQGFSIEAGLQYWANQKLCLGIHIANPNQSTYGTSGLPIPRQIQIGASYRFSDQLLLASGVNQLSNNLRDMYTALEYSLLKWFLLRGGVSINPLKHYVGFGMYYGSFRFDVATSSHAALGYTPQLTLSYEL